MPMGGLLCISRYKTGGRAAKESCKVAFFVILSAAKNLVAITNYRCINEILRYAQDDVFSFWVALQFSWWTAEHPCITANRAFSAAFACWLGHKQCWRNKKRHARIHCGHGVLFGSMFFRVYQVLVMPGNGAGYWPLGPGLIEGSAFQSQGLGPKTNSEFMACSQVISWPV